MKSVGAKYWRLGVWLGPALTVMVVIGVPAVGADRRVLCEEFTDVN